MDFFGLLRVMFRRWFVVVPVLVATVVVGVTFIGETQVRYSASGSALLVTDRANAAQAEQETVVVNSIAGPLLQTALGQASYRRTLDDRGLVSDYVINPLTGPTVVTVELESGDANAVLETGRVIADESFPLLESFLTEADASAVTLRVVGELTPDDVVTVGDVSSLSLSIAILPTAGDNPNPYPPNVPTARVVLDIAQRPQVLFTVAGAGQGLGYSATIEEDDSAAVVSLSVTAPNQADLAPAYEALLEALNDELEALQLDAETGSDGLTKLVTLAPPGSGAQTSSSIVRPAVGIALLGVALACVLAVLVDTLILRRRAKQRSDAERDELDDDVDDTDNDRSRDGGGEYKGDRDLDLEFERAYGE